MSARARQELNRPLLATSDAVLNCGTRGRCSEGLDEIVKGSQKDLNTEIKDKTAVIYLAA